MTGRFDVRDLHPSLDVFTRDGVFLGSILKIVPAAGASGGSGADTGASWTDGEQERPAAPPTSRVSGELLGPMPTSTLGNPGPAAQSAAGGYRATPDDAQALDGGTMVVGTWRGLVGRRTIPLDQIMSVSLERVILKQTHEELAAGR